MFRNGDVKWQAVVAAVADKIRAGRAVLIGTRSVDASEHLGRLLTKSGFEPVILNARHDRREAEIVAAAGEPGRITVATNMAGRGTDIRIHPSVREAGGLHVILTEYHESRRIDRQLFGRAGRQGDPGSYECIVAIDDELFRRFAGTRVLGMVTMAAPNMPEIPGSIALTLRAFSQFAAEHAHARARRTAMSHDDRFRKLLGFAGAE
jgi:preprotein translocase subunit SecA